MNKTLFRKYSELDSQIKDLTEKKELLKDQCFQEMKKEEVDKVSSEWGTFSIYSRNSWIYSIKVKKQEESLKLLKKKEEEKGIAKAEVSESLRFQSIKPE